MSAIVLGRLIWGGSRNSYGHRTWTVSHKLRTTSKNDGPFTVMNCSGLPAVGAPYTFGNDIDTWAYCYPDMKVSMAGQHDDYTYTWITEQTFSTQPLQRCNTTTITNPLLEPYMIGGSFVKYTEEATVDLYGNPFLSSSFERFRGRDVEFDANRPTVWFEQNFSTNYISIFAPLVDCVNDDVLWGLPERCVKLSNASWERKLYGICNYYYRVRLDFDINYNTFDRYIPDHGTKVLNGHWAGAQGSGCTINITVSGSPSGNSRNPITSASINTAGSGYPATQAITLAIVGGSGTGGSVKVTTDGSGIPVGGATVVNGGQGYASATGLATRGSTWVLDQISGHTPVFNNPLDFMDAVDINGNRTMIPLDGFGQPAVGTRPAYFFAQKYVSQNLLLLGIPATL